MEERNKKGVKEEVESKKKRLTGKEQKSGSQKEKKSSRSRR